MDRHDPFESYDFASLSITDLLNARDQYHFHLMNKANVVGTAIGLYLIRNDEDWPTRVGEGRTPKKKLTFPRTLANSQVRDYSWPCVLVFVRKWEDLASFREAPWAVVPKTLYLADGRAVPVCVVEADSVPAASLSERDSPPLPSSKLGGGMPIYVDVQHETRMATAGCLVSDGHLTFALTARHVSGDKGTVVTSATRGGDVLVGTGSAKQLTRLPFSKVYPDFPGRRSFLNLDIGLVELDNITQWTSNIHGLPPIGQLADFYEQNLSLNLIDCPVVAMGAASGLLRGTIKGLFYRYSSVGGYDNVADFMIAPSQNSSNTRHGDSGAIWHLDLSKDDKIPLLKRQLRPLAIEWGGQTFDIGGARSAFAIATSLSNACKLLNVELVTNNEADVSGYWGRTGHYSIAELAIDQVQNKSLRALLSKNRELLSFDLDTIANKNFSKTDAKDETRLADVPDDVWKHMPKGGKTSKKGGRDTGSRSGPEHPNHFADVDVAYLGSTLGALCLKDPAKYLTPSAWQKYYAFLHTYYVKIKDTEGAKNAARKDKQGLLPFRIWQIFDDMAGFVANKEFDKFVCAAGIFAHYVGDASQPLHASALADGDRTRKVSNPTKVHSCYGSGSHSAYESDMLDVAAGDGLLLPAIRKYLKGKTKLPAVSSGNDAALATMHLIADAAKRLPPQHILDIYEEVGGWKTKAQANRREMWEKLGERTGEVMALGVEYLAHFWDAAWAAGGSPNAKPTEFTSKEMSSLYCSSKFLPSYTLNEIGKYLKTTTAPARKKRKAPQQKRARKK